MNAREQVLAQLARESGHWLGELGVRPDDQNWIRQHSETIASLRIAGRPRRGNLFYRLARRVARIAR